jgi:hypothetical protein
MPLPDLRIASTMEKLLCSVFSACTAACHGWSVECLCRRAALDTYIVVALHPAGGMEVSIRGFVYCEWPICTRQEIHGHMIMLRELETPTHIDVFGSAGVAVRVRR